MALFDPFTGAVLDREALKSVRFGGARKPRQVERDGVKYVEVLNEATGGLGGYHTHHPDGRIDATVCPDPVELRATAPELKGR